LKSKLEIIDGVDEAGRGPLAGPVVAAAVILPYNHSIEGLADSKKLSPKKREKLFEEIQSVSDVGVGVISHKKIDKINILQGTYQAMRQALDNLVVKPEKALIDGFALPDYSVKNEGIVDGDNKVESISAASIIAKVTRDRIMRNVAPIFPDFRFEKHKGYGTKLHMEVLNEFKATPIHRKSFEPVKRNLPTKEWMKDLKKIGKMGEQMVALQYLSNGYQIIEMNKTCSHYGELDVIAEKNGELIFVEVKTVSKDQIGKLKLQVDQLKLAIQYYLSEMEEEKNIRLDIATVMLAKKTIINTTEGISLV
jgi:ribonuclease HII/Holliday junction resolvase-like predicted endonuclease